MKIAVVSSGLWHVYRGVEVWAFTLAEALAVRGMDVTLFTGSDITGGKEYLTCKMRTLPCWHRSTRSNAWLAKICSKLGGWRYGFGSEYQVEQATIAPGLIKALRAGRYNVVHLQDPWLALRLEKSRENGAHSAAVILAHGTEEPVEFLRRFSHVQELSPYYLERHKDSTRQGQARYCIPNFVNTSEFRQADKLICRRSLGLPEESFIVLSVGAIGDKHKKMHRLVDEFALIEKKNAMLVIAGHCGNEADFELISYASKRLGGRFRCFGDLSHAEMPALYSSADLFVLCSTNEIFGIVFLEAMACGIPCVGHKYPVTEWIIGDGGTCIDMNNKGFMVGLLSDVTPEWIQSHGSKARVRAEKIFSSEVVIGQIVEMYESMGTRR
ncbi:MAG: hypothetical protein A2283_13710 [Lentisphaerae bacterium RIFOXYA12_FULL_48_11]|nr:MAG: hypothetical protein A2283_13710 [Lentisphaerae bacterium RIFOXYA12_FULL_48_11]